MDWTRRRFVAALAAAILAPAGASGHEGGLDARGTIREVSAKEVVLETADGERRSFAVTDGTEVRRGSAPAKIGDLRIGERAVVHARKTAAGAEAVSIRLAREPPGAR